MKGSSEVLVIFFLSHKVYLPSIQAIYKMFWDISVVYCSGGGGGGGDWHASPGIPKTNAGVTSTLNDTCIIFF